MQNSEELVVWFRIPIEASKNDISIEIKTGSISISYGGTLMLEGELLHSIKADESSWTITPARYFLFKLSC